MGRTPEGDQLFHDNLLISLSGFLVGLLVGQTGTGGGSLMTPLLVLLFGIHPATAVGTDLLYASATKSVGTLVHGMNHTVNWRIVGRLAAGSVPATAATLLLLSRFDLNTGGAGAAISAILGVMLLFTALALVFRRPRWKVRVSSWWPPASSLVPNRAVNSSASRRSYQASRKLS